MNLHKKVNKAVKIWSKRIDEGNISGKLVDALTEECWIVQLQGLEGCRNCEYLGTKECGGGFKFLNLVLKHRGYVYPSIFLTSSTKRDGSIEQVKRNKHMILQAIRYFIKEVYSKQEAEETRIVSLDWLYPYTFVRDIGKRIYKNHYHYPKLCTCETFGKKTVPRDEWYQIANLTLVYYHQHCIIADNGSEITLDSCGYRTATTKERMNAYFYEKGYDIRVYQQNYEWYIEHNGQTIKFRDGIKLKLK